MVTPGAEAIYTIGHSNHTVARLLELLAARDVAVLVDVRSSPYSKYAAQFNHDALQAAVTEAGLEYVYLGEALGGMPRVPGFYDEEGYVRYDRIAASERFREGLGRLIALAGARRVALLCAEENPLECHRHLLLARVLGEQSVPVLHLRGDGSVESAEAVRQAAELARTGGQQALFEEEEEAPWRSTHSVSRANPPKRSSSP